MKRFLCLLLGFLLCTAMLYGCVEVPDDGIALSEKTKQELSDALFARENRHIYWKSGAWYCGTYDGCIVFFETDRWHEGSIGTVGEHEFRLQPGGSLWAYRDGTLYSLQEAYDNHLLTDEHLGQLQTVCENHKPTYKTEGATVSEVQSHMTPLSEETLEGINLAFVEQDPQMPYWDGTIGYYGTYGDCVVILQEGMTAAVSYLQAGDYMFQHGSGFTIYVYADGELMKLYEAYEQGLLTFEDIQVIYTCHTIGEYSQTLSDSLRAEIVDYYGKTGKYDDEDTVAGKQYYGTYNGYVILMDAGQLSVYVEVDIGGRLFTWGSGSLKLDAYKDGQVISLKELYESGGITEADLDQILENHNAYKTRYPEG